MQTISLEQARDSIKAFKADFDKLKEQVHFRFMGQDDLVNDLLCGFFAGGHILMEGVPGLGKTVLAKTLAQVSGVGYERIQCTPDLMPGDITGYKSLIETEDGKHKVIFEQGPIVSNFILVDEINRATPKTQSAMLEAMQEGQVTIGKEVIVLPKPNFFIATQNPVEHEGTYPLPEAQLDRFIAKLKVNYPEKSDYHRIIESTTSQLKMDIKPVISADRIIEMQNIVRSVEITDSAIDYIVDIVRSTQPQCSSISSVMENVSLGASPRAVQAVVLLAKVKAVVDDRSCVSIEDIKNVVYIALRHRLVLNFAAAANGVDSDDIIADILENLDAVER